ncbi:MAG: hypothetical protein IIX57_04070 [Lachnospiraceae bacterium]|nr:hypothetical protein [Lachnospiraceae bacterium]
MALYSYNGPVLEFDRIITNNWQAQTYATSEAKARANLAYQFKKVNGKEPRTKITLPGKIVVEGDE